MSTRKDTAPAPATDTAAEAIKPAEQEYTAKEFAAASETVFGKNVKPECVIAAFRVAKEEKATVSWAQVIVDNFLRKGIND